MISTAVAMIRNSYDGMLLESLRDAAVLLGGYISTGRINESEAIKVLQEEIRWQKTQKRLCRSVPHNPRWHRIRQETPTS